MLLGVQTDDERWNVDNLRKIVINNVNEIPFISSRNLSGEEKRSLMDQSSELHVASTSMSLLDSGWSSGKFA